MFLLSREADLLVGQNMVGTTNLTTWAPIAFPHLVYRASPWGISFGPLPAVGPHYIAAQNPPEQTIHNLTTEGRMPTKQGLREMYEALLVVQDIIVRT